MRRLAALALLAAPPAFADPGKVLHQEVKSGAVWALQGGTWAAIPDARVTLTCRQTAASRKNQMLQECDSSLRVERGGKTIAERKDGIRGYSYEAAGGNNGSVELELLAAGEGGYVRVNARLSEGDEPSHDLARTQLFVVDGSGLREVHDFDMEESYTRAPDAPPDFPERWTGVEIEIGEERTGGLPNLLTLSRQESPKSAPTTQVLAWNGKAYAPCPSCKPIAARPRAAAAPAGDPSLIDGSTGASFEPILALLLAGKPVDPPALQPLSAQTLLLLRNAPYARHGRPFKMSELQAFFYGPRPGVKSILPLAVSPDFQESLLDAIDRANVQAVITEQKRR